MCLYVNTTKPAPTKNFSVWKTIEITDLGNLRTPHKYAPVLAGELVPSSGPVSAQVGSVVNGGAIHCYANAKRANSRKDEITLIVRCVVKPSEFIAWGNSHDVAVTKLRLSQKTLTNALKSHAKWLRTNLQKQRVALAIEQKKNQRIAKKALRKLAK